MVVGLALLAFFLSFLPVLIVQQRVARSVGGLLLTSLVQIGLSAVALWAMLRYAGHAADRQGEASAIGMMIALLLPGLRLAAIVNALVGLWYLVRIWQRGQA